MISITLVQIAIGWLLGWWLLYYLVIHYTKLPWSIQQHHGVCPHALRYHAPHLNVPGFLNLREDNFRAAMASRKFTYGTSQQIWLGDWRCTRLAFWSLCHWRNCPLLAIILFQGGTRLFFPKNMSIRFIWNIWTEIFGFNTFAFFAWI